MLQLISLLFKMMRIVYYPRILLQCLTNETENPQNGISVSDNVDYAHFVSFFDAFFLCISYRSEISTLRTILWSSAQADLGNKTPVEGSLVDQVRCQRFSVPYNQRNALPRITPPMLASTPEGVETHPQPEAAVKGDIID